MGVKASPWMMIEYELIESGDMAWTGLFIVMYHGTRFHAESGI